MRLELVGNVPVDAGNVVIIDACYLKKQMTSRPRGTDEFRVREHVAGDCVLGIEVHTRDGDGYLPVYRVADERDRALGVFVSFFEGYDNNERIGELFPAAQIDAAPNGKRQPQGVVRKGDEVMMDASYKTKKEITPTVSCKDCGAMSSVSFGMIEHSASCKFYENNVPSSVTDSITVIEAWFVTFRGEPVSLGFPTRQLADKGISAMNGAFKSADAMALHHPHTAGNEWGASPFQVVVRNGQFIMPEDVVGYEAA